MKDYRKKLQRITTFVFDYDGVLTDGKIWVSDDGKQYRCSSVKDGYAIQLALKLGFKIAIISGAVNVSILNRCKMLKIEDVFLGIEDKKNKLLSFVAENNLNLDEVLYMGDDIPDFEAMLIAGVSACPNDAAIEIKQIADICASKNGGEGCVREVIEQVLRSQDKWMTPEAFKW